MLLHSPRAPDHTELAMTLLAQEAVASHAAYAADRGHPIEVPDSEKPELAQWLSDRLKRTVAPRDLSAVGYHLIGGRLLVTERGGAAALLMYAALFMYE
jgi:anti-sigma factor RsiW